MAAGGGHAAAAFCGAAAAKARRFWQALEADGAALAAPTAARSSRLVAGRFTAAGGEPERVDRGPQGEQDEVAGDTQRGHLRTQLQDGGEREMEEEQRHGLKTAYQFQTGECTKQ